MTWYELLAPADTPALDAFTLPQPQLYSVK